MRPEFDICMIVHNDVIHDSRILKEAGSLAAQGWRVAVLGITLGKKDLPEEEIINGFTVYRVTPKLFRGLLPGRIGLLLPILPMVPTMALRLRDIKAKIYHAHDFIGLFHTWLAGMGGKRIVYDSHELFFDRPLPDLPVPVIWLLNLLRRFEKPMARRTVSSITVNDSIANHLARTLDIKTPVVIKNAVDLRQLEPEPATVFPVEEDKRIIVHTGNLLYGRSLLEIVQSLVYLPDDYVLVLMGKEGSEKPKILALIEEHQLEGRVVFVPPVPPQAVASTIQQADVAIALMTTEGLNNQYSLPNKFFEAIAAGLPTVTGPNVEIAAVVSEYGLGETCDSSDPKSIAAAIQKVLESENYAHYKVGAERARADLNWENEEKKLIALYTGLLGAEG